MKDILIDLKKLLSTTGEAPKPLGNYHLLWITAVIIITITLVTLFSDASNKTTRIIIATIWILMLIFEIIKQIHCSLYVSGDQITWSYNWGAFPYQFCATPLYILPFAAFSRDGWHRRTAIVFLSSFAIIGGLAIFIFPNSVLSGNKFVDFQSMFHHGIQIFLGVYLASRYRNLLTNEHFKGATIAFLFMAYLAILLNVTYSKISTALEGYHTFNMFFLSPYERYVPPALKDVGIETLPYPVFLIGYLSLFILAAYALMKTLKLVTDKINYEKIWSITKICKRR